MNLTPDELKTIAAEASDFLKQLANKQRLMILCHLLDGEMSVSQFVREAAEEKASKIGK